MKIVVLDVLFREYFMSGEKGKDGREVELFISEIRLMFPFISHRLATGLPMRNNDARGIERVQDSAVIN